MRSMWKMLSGGLMFMLLSCSDRAPAPLERAQAPVVDESTCVTDEESGETTCDDGNGATDIGGGLGGNGEGDPSGGAGGGGTGGGGSPAGGEGGIDQGDGEPYPADGPTCDQVMARLGFGWTCSIDENNTMHITYRAGRLTGTLNCVELNPGDFECFCSTRTDCERMLNDPDLCTHDPSKVGCDEDYSRCQCQVAQP
ncbi:MAG: hypothetical protein U1E65_22540 [Myxococcota bacterium]